MKKDNMNNSLQETAKLAIHTWNNRGDITIPILNKTFKNKNKIPTLVQDVINNHWQNYELKPLIVEKNYKDNKYTFVIHLPAGAISYNDFKSKENYFYDAVPGQVLIERRGKAVILTVLEGELPKKQPYEFDPLQYPKMFLPFPVGMGVNGLLVRDLASFPCMLIGGVQGSGKSNIIHNINTSLLIGRKEECFIVCIDFKKSEYAMYMQNNGLLVTNEFEADKVINKLNSELTKRQEYIAGKVIDVRNLPADQRPPFILIEVDEITEMQDPKTQWQLTRLLRLGRNVGFVVVLATQRPSVKTFKNSSFGEMRDLCDARMCFRVRSPESSQMIINNSKGIDLPTIRGRGIFSWDVELEVQTLYLNPEKISKIIGESRGGVSEENYSEQFRDFKQSPKMLPPR